MITGFLIGACTGWILALIVKTEDDAGADPESWEWEEGD